MNTRDQLNEYITGYPRECLTLLVIGLSFLWQSVAAILALIIYVLYIRVFSGPRWLLFSAGLVIAWMAIYLRSINLTVIEFVQNGFLLNLFFWKLIFQHKFDDVFTFLLNYECIYIMGFTLLIAGILSLIDLIPNNPHKETMKALHKGVHPEDVVEVKEKIINKALKNLGDCDYNGTVLGVSKYSGKYVILPDHDINQVVFVLGTTGSGKTITLRRFYQRALFKGYPLIIIDGKPDVANIEWIQNLAEKHGKPFFGFNCANKLNYDPLADGGFTELKDKIICLKDQWENDYYRSIAEDYLQTALQILLKSSLTLDLKQIVECLNYRELVKLTNATQNEQLMKRVKSLNNYEIKDINGLQAHLNILIHSELGSYFEKDQTTFSLSEVIDQQGVVYFALPVLRFPSFSRVVGKLVINDIKAVIDHKRGQPVFTIFDEFSVFAGEQIINLVNMGRGKGIHAVFGTQGLADLDRIDVAFKNQILNCVNTLICHRLNDQESAETVASWVGTQYSFNITAQLGGDQSGTGLGSIRRIKEFILHPDEIKQNLQTGEAFHISKVGRFKWDKLKVKA